MIELCKNLKLSIVLEADPWENLAERVRLTLSNEWLEAEVCAQVNQISEKTAKSSRYFTREAVIIALRRLVDQAFQQGLISDAPGKWMISSTDTIGPSEPQSTKFETGWELS